MGGVREVGSKAGRRVLAARGGARSPPIAGAAGGLRVGVIVLVTNVSPVVMASRGMCD